MQGNYEHSGSWAPTMLCVDLKQHPHPTKEAVSTEKQYLLGIKIITRQA